MAQLLTGTRVYGNTSIDSQLIVGNVTSWASTSNTTGSLVVSGGVGVSGNIYVGGTTAGVTGVYTDVLRYAANGLPWVMGSSGGGYLANTIIVANSTGYLSNSNSFYTSSNNTFIATGNLKVLGSVTANNYIGTGSGVATVNSASNLD